MAECGLAANLETGTRGKIVGSHYNRRDRDDDILFSVAPAPYPGDKAAEQIMMLGVGAICVGVLLLLFVVGIAFIGLGIAWIVQSRKLRARWRRENEGRKPKDILVNASGVVVDGCAYAAADIAEFVVTHPDAATGGRTGAAVVDLKNAQIAVSYQACLRLRSDSRPIVLVDGLTQQTASALVRDMAEVLVITRNA
jgi:hypothetical protein